MFSAKELIDIAIRLERNAEDYYRQALNEVSDPSIESLLIYLANQEAKHIHWFEDLKRRVKTPSDQGGMPELGATLLERLIGNHRFSLEEVDLSKIDKVESLIELAIEFEEDSILFYEMLGTIIDNPDDLGVLKEIISEENRHIQVLKEYGDGLGLNSSEG